MARFSLTNVLFSKRLIRIFSRNSSNSSTNIKTCLYDFHCRHGGVMVEFAGHSMPLQYKSHSIINSHNWVRDKCGLFDVSHMLQFRISGIHREDFVHSLTVIDMKNLQADYGGLSLFTNEEGGIMDDTIINNCSRPHYYVVSNAGCADKIKNHLMNWQEIFQKRGKDVRIDWIDNGLIALQGPLTTKILQPGLEISLTDIYFGRGVECSVFGIPNCRVTRCGYTGEDGVEISVNNNAAEELAEKLVSNSDVIPIGLGARDTLRLEAGLCLYGNDIDETTTPSEAALSWTIGAGRKIISSEKSIKFPGYDKIMSQVKKESPIPKIRIGFISKEGPPPRGGTEILNEKDELIGKVTSGCFSPYLTINIGMGYVERNYMKPETQVKFRIRGKVYPGFVSKLPFVKTKYYILKK